MVEAASRPKYNIFVSHSSKDSPFGQRLIADLKRNLNPDEKVWYDSEGGRYDSDEGFLPGDKWYRVLNDKLDKCNVFLALLSKSAIRSRWVRDEVEYAITRSITGRLRIIVIRLDDCKIPPGLQNRYQIIDHAATNDYQKTFDHLLRGLRLPPEPENPDTALVHQVMRQIDVAFACGDWIDVIRRIPSTIKRFPEMASSSIYLMFARALLERGELQQSQIVLENAFNLEMNEQSNKLLEGYVQRLVEEKHWKTIVSCAEHMIQRSPHLLLWPKVKQYALDEIHKEKGPSFSNNPFDISSQPSDNVSTFATMNFGNSTWDMPTFISTPDSIDVDAIVPPPEDDTFNGFEDVPEPNSTRSLWDDADTLTDLHLPPHKVQRVFGSASSLWAGVFNALGLFLIVSTWSISWWLVCIIGVTVAFIFILGRLLGRKFKAIVFASLMAVFWCAIGGSVGRFILFGCHQLSLAPSSSQAACIVILSVIPCCFLGFSWHQGLFRGEDEHQ